MNLKKVKNKTNEENTNINFGLQPISNRFLKNKTDKSPHFLLEVSWNNVIGCPQILNPWPVDEIRPQFDWITCFEPEDHLDDLCNIILDLKGQDPEITVAEYSFKDKTTLDRLYKLGYKKQWIIDPKNDLSIVDPLSNVETFQSVFNKISANKISKKNGKVDIFIVRHVIEHAYDLSEFINSLKLLIKEDGYIVFELPDCEQAFMNGDCTAIWEEHTYYFFETSFKRCMIQNDLEIVFWKKWKYPLENCIVAIVREKFSNKVCKKFSKQINHDFIIYNNFVKIFEKRKVNIKTKLKKYTQKNGKVCILGAGHLTIAFISLLEVTEFIDFVIDDNDNKSGYFLPTGVIPIKKTEYLKTSDTKLCLLGANPQHHEKIKKNLNTFKNNGGIVCSIFPNTKDYLEDII